MDHASIVTDFIRYIWNQRQYSQLNHFLHPAFTDHSLAPHLPTGAEGLKQWIEATSASFDHTTFIEDQVTENGQSIVRVRMELKHTGSWRGIAATGMELSTTGYRQFYFRDGKIIAHHALIDGQTIEARLTDAARGCRVPQP